MRYGVVDRPAFKVYFCLIVLICLFTEIARAQCEEPVDVPLIRLIAAPEKFQGILVRTLGFVRLEFEGNVIYPYKEDYKNGLVGNGIWLDINNKDIEQNYKHGMKYFLIVATFDANRRGHFGMWSGSLTNIKRFEIWSDPANPRSEKIGQALKREKKKEVKSKRKAMKW